jgi:hypothetical protein
MSAVQQYTQPSAYTEEDEQTVNNAFANGQRYLGDDRGSGTEQQRRGEPQPAFGPRA